MHLGDFMMDPAVRDCICYVGSVSQRHLLLVSIYRDRSVTGRGGEQRKDTEQERKGMEEGTGKKGE